MRTALALLLACAPALFAADKSDWKINLDPVGQVKANYPATFQVTLTDAKGRPVPDADVQLVVTMVEMDHGEFKNPAKSVKAGVYEAKPTFFMVGKWNVDVKVKKGDDTTAKKFTYDVKE